MCGFPSTHLDYAPIAAFILDSLQYFGNNSMSRKGKKACFLRSCLSGCAVNSRWISDKVLA